MNKVTAPSILLSSCYLAPVSYYALIMQAGVVTIEVCDHYQKQSYRNRCHIAGANGIQTLSIPIEKPTSSHFCMKDIRIADYGNWQHIHWHAIISAYRSTPFFQYYEDDFRPFYEQKQRFLHDFNEGLRERICQLLGIESTAFFTDNFLKETPPHIQDFRERIHPKKEDLSPTPSYYQVFAQKNGFIHNLSIIDLLFNMGNEARIILGQFKNLLTNSETVSLETPE